MSLFKKGESDQVQTASYDAHAPLTLRQELQYTSGDGGYHFMMNWINVYLTVFCTDTLGVPAAAVASLLLWVRIFDAINDPIIGNMADRTRSKWGRYRPWMFWGSIALGLLIAALFCGNPSWSVGFKTAYVYVIYILITIASTCLNMPYGAMNGVITANSRSRLRLGSQRMIFMYGCAGIVGFVAFPLVYKFAGNTGNTMMDMHRGWSIVVPVFCLLGMFLECRTAIKVREAVLPAKNSASQKMTILDIWKAVIKNPPLIILTLGMIVYGIMAYGRMAMFAYYFRYYCHNYGYMSTYSLLNAIFGVLGSFSATTINKWVKSKGKTAALGMFLMGLFNIFCFWVPATNPVFFVFMALSSFSGAFYISTQYGMIPDTADYGELVSGQSLHGFTNAFTSLGLKVGGAVGPALGVAVLGAYHYVPNVEQTAETLQAMNVTATLAPGLLCILASFIFFLYPLNPKRVSEMRATLDARRA